MWDIASEKGGQVMASLQNGKESSQRKRKAISNLH